MAFTRIASDSVGWSQTEINAFHTCREALCKGSRLAHLEDNKRICFYVDALDDHWVGITTQIPIEDIHLPHNEKRHEPLSFLSGRFTDTQSRWSTFEEEAYSMMDTIERMHWLASCPKGFDLFTDHNNLVFIFDPLSLVPDTSQASMLKVSRWVIRLSIYNNE